MEYITKLNKMGVVVYNRPDIYDGENKSIAIIIDEREDYIKMKDAITFIASTECIEAFIDIIFEDYSEGFITDIIKGINEYLYDHSRVIKGNKFSPKEWWEAVIPMIALAFDRYGIDLSECDHTEYIVAKKRLGGRKGIVTAVKNALENQCASRCAMCEHCRININGEYYCKRIIVESDRTNGSILARMLTGNKFASNLCSDIVGPNDDCECFSSRDKSLMKKLRHFVMDV